MKTPKQVFRSIKKTIDQNGLMGLISSCMRAAGVKTTYVALLLFYAFKRKETPNWARRIILGTIAYLVAPLDAIPDLSPFLGFTDDFGMLMFGLVSVAGYIDADVREKARHRIDLWFGTTEESEFLEVEQALNV